MTRVCEGTERGGAEDHRELSARLRFLRVNCGMSLRAATNLAGITAGALSQLEKC